MKQTVFVGLSGGVDSSVTAVRMLEEGYRVVGVYMKNWTQDMPGFACPWKDDYQDAKRVAVQLGIDFLVFDFEDQYRQKVVDYMIEEYRLGRTPNPDIMCNQEVKFKLFLDTAVEQGADYIATGHYARTRDGKLLRAANQSKDQTYFLARVSESALKKTHFPIGDFGTKDEVRSIAERHGLVTASKKDSQGICFVGKVGIREFLQQFVESSPGSIIDQYGQTVGEHDGAIFYTIGQRHGLGVGGGLPMYVTSKDMQSNTVYVSTDLSDPKLWASDVVLESPHWINGPPDSGTTYDVQLRYRGPLVKGKINGEHLKLEQPQRAISPGQSAVIYDSDRVVGSAIVSAVQSTSK